MKIDYRKSQTPDLTKPFRDYRSHNTLVGWYKFNSKTTQTSFSNRSSGNMSAAQVEKQRNSSTSEQVFGGPYVGETDDYSISFRENYFKNVKISDTASQFGNNPPFTVAGWFKIPNINFAGSDTFNELVRRQAPGSNEVQLSWAIDFQNATKQIRFAVSGSHPVDPTAQVTIRTPDLTTFVSGSIKSDQWFHFAATVSSISGNASSIPINGNVKVYINGKIASLAGSAESGTSTGGTGTTATIIPDFTPNNINGSIFVGKERDDSSAASPALYSNFDIHELAFWRSELSADEIYSLWSTARWWQGSGIVSDSPRNVLRARDNQSTLPTIDWPAIDRRIVFSGIPYDDQATTRVFQTSSRPLTLDYPSMIPTVDSDLRAKTVLTPNTHPQMTVNSGEGAGVYSEFQPEIKDDDPYNINPYFNIFFSPFNESQVHVDDDRLSLVYPMPINATKITRSITGSFPGYRGETSTGVFYYNLNRRRFDIIGNRDPLRYRDLYYTASDTESVSLPANGMFAGARKRLGMFQEQNSDFLSLSKFATPEADSWVTSSFKNIGQPTSKYGGPANIRLYATSSYIFDMSKLINKPFAIESIELEISGAMVKSFDGWVSHAFPTDAYTFFLLRQTAERRDSPNSSTISGSYREIVAFKSVLAWNSKAEWTGSYGPAIDALIDALGGSGLQRTSTTASSDWFGNYDDFAYAAQYNVDDPYSVVTKTLPFKSTIMLKPRISPAGILEPVTSLQNPPSLWAGSNANIGQTLRLVENATSKYDYAAFGTPAGGLPILDLTYAGSSGYFNDAIPSSRTDFPFASNTKEKNNVYNQYFVGFEGSPPDSYFSSKVLENLDTEYLIFPEDNLVLGIEANPSAPEAGLFIGPPYYTYSTSSYLELPAQEAQLVIKGRYLKNQEYYGAPFAQQLTTDAIHTSLHYDNPVLDQFEIAQSKEYARSLRDLLITGSLTKPETGWPRFPRDSSDPLKRTSLGSVISGQAGDLASLQRNYRIVDAVEKYYDSFVPDVEKMWKIDGYIPISQIDAGGSIFSIYNVTTFNASPDDTNENKLWLSNFPFESKFSPVKRVAGQNGELAALVLAYELNNATAIYNVREKNGAVWYDVDFNMIRGVRTNSSTSEVNYTLGILGTSQYAVMKPAGRNIFFFGVGDGPYGIHIPILRQDYSGSPTYVIEKPRGYKYGLINANPVGTSAVYRSTRYGQFRDMLEQRQYTALLIEQPENKSNIFEPKKSKSGINKPKRVSKKEAPVRFPVTVKFREPIHENPTGLTTTSPINTQCSNISLYATSSLPFFDDDVPRNRDYPSGSV